MSIRVKELGMGLKILAGHMGMERGVGSAQIIAPDLSLNGEKREWASSIIHIRPSQVAYLCALPRRERMRLVRRIMEQKPVVLWLVVAPFAKNFSKRRILSKFRF